MQEVIFIDHSASLGGAELALSRYLAWGKRDLSIHLILFEEGDLADIARQCTNLRLTILKASSLPQRVLELQQILSKEKGKLCIANSFSAFLHLSLVPAARGRVIDYLRQEAYPFEASKAKKLFLKYAAYPAAKGFLSNSDYSLSTLQNPQQEALGKVIYTVSGRSQNDLVSHLNPVHTPLRLLSLSRLSPWKGVHIIMDAVLELNQAAGEQVAELTVAGGNLFNEPEYFRKLQELADKSQGAITLIGHVSDVSGLLQEQDILISASTNPEPFGQILVQGISAGLLTIGTAHGGAQEIIQDQVNGLLTQPGNVDSLVEAIRWVLKNPEKVTQLRQKGIESAYRFTDEETLPLLEKSLESFLP